MPDRRLRDGIIYSDAVNALSPGAELFYRRLMSVHDDFGRFHAEPHRLRPACYPLQLDRVREADVKKWRDECSSTTPPLIRLYEVDGKQYLLVDKTDRPRAHKSKFPDPPDWSWPLEWTIRAQPNADANGCAQPQTNAPNAYSIANARTISSAVGKRPTKGEVFAARITEAENGTK